ncbi:hypothetical protein LUZ62_086804 [Rhynchospora pubera]|uniref:F-box domain-containing protein n=1 Tax=Rhynchospora pubera TaxID=906938 RepID=A0AAV8C9K3_9POAL|nr:hypothetical protein LUZ62_086804 [Rhynchospora pubera]
MVFSHFNHYHKVYQFISNQAGNREREEDTNGEKGRILTYLRRKQEIAKVLACERRRKREYNRGGGEGGISFKEGRALIPGNKERKLTHGSSPQTSEALMPHSTIDWRSHLNKRLCNREGEGGGISFKEGGAVIPVNNETKLIHGSSPRTSFLMHHSTPNWPLSQPLSLYLFSFMVFSQFKRLKGLHQAGNRERKEDNIGEKGGILTKIKSKLANAAEKVLSYVRGQSTVEWSYLTFDMWTEVAKHMGGKELIVFSLVSHWFKDLVAQDDLWKQAFLRDMQITVDCHVNASWREIYASAFNGSHSFSPDHEYFGGHPIARRRLGAFSLTSHSVLLTHTLSLPNVLPPALTEEFTDNIVDVCILDNAKIGIWIADCHMVPGQFMWNHINIGLVCVLDCRHCELFVEERYQNGTWFYEEIARGLIFGHCDEARAGIFNVADIMSPATSQFFNANTWAGIPTADGVQLRNNSNAVALSANLEENLGICALYRVMRDSNDEVVSIRILNFVPTVLV